MSWRDQTPPAAAPRSPVSTPLAALLAAAVGAVLGGCFNPLARRLPHARPVARPELVALATAALAAGVVLARHGTTARVLGVALTAVLVAVSVIDIQSHRIPNLITGPAALLAVALGLALHPAGVPAQLLAGIAGAGFLFVFAVADPRGLGMGDVKLAGVLGLYLGGAVAVALFAGVVAAALAGLGVIARHGVSVGRRTGIPLGPFLALGACVALGVGPQLLHWYATRTPGI